MIENKLIVSPSPHLHCGSSTKKVMLDVIIALLPTLAISIVLFGIQAFILECVSVATCILAEYITRRILKKNNTIGDLSAVVTGLLIAFNVPSTLPFWMIIIADIVAIVVVKQLFGGIGQNFVNPAIVGRIVLMISFPSQMSTWIAPLQWKSNTDAITSATPLKIINELPSLSEMFNGNFGKYNPIDLLLGLRGGCIGETCIIALLLGFAYLLYRKVISPVIPLVFMGTTTIICWIAGQNPIYVLMSGGLVLGAVFMATDYTTSPINFKGKIIYAFGCGLITALIRLFGNLPEGVSFSIILMNILVPHIEDLTTPKPFGYIKEKRGAKNEK